jgi:hypothetical protein
LEFRGQEPKLSICHFRDSTLIRFQVILTLQETTPGKRPPAGSGNAFTGKRPGLAADEAFGVFSLFLIDMLKQSEKRGEVIHFSLM